jgi:hypothetical protein
MTGHVAAVLATLILGDQLVAQEVHLVPDEPACPDCEIVLTPNLRLGETEGPGMIDWRGGQSFPATDSKGRIFLRGYFSTEIKVYDPNGGFIKSLGGEGLGPGEFRGVQGIVVGAADSLFVLDVLAMRLSVFSSDLTFARSSALSIRPSGFDPMVVDWDPDHLFLSAHVRTQPLIGLPIHRLTREGAHVESFGAPEASYSPTNVYGGSRVIADAGDGSVWSGHLAHYRIERVAPGRREAFEEIRRDAELFPEPSPEVLGGDLSNGSPPLVVAIKQDGERLWVLTWTQDPKWQQSSGELEEEHLLYDSVVEVIDLLQHRVVARSRFDDLYHTLLPDGRIGGTVFVGGLVPVYQIMDMKIRGESPAPVRDR